MESASGCRRTFTVSFAVAALLAISAASAHAQAISGLSATTSGSTANSGDTSGSTRSSVAFTTNTAATVATRFAWNVSADVGIRSTRDQNGNAQHNISFNVTAPGGYRLDVSQSRVGVIERGADASNCAGAADTSGITGSQSGASSTTGTLNIGDPGSVPDGGGDSSVPFNQSASASLFATSNGAAHGHALTFTWNGSVRSNSCEAAVRQGEGSSVSGCQSCIYPGTPSRTQATDGHFVTVSLTSLCGNGTIDASVGEQCDQGGANGSASSCCTSTCQFRASGQQCRASAGVCDPAETCSGSSATCPADAKSTDVCRPAADDCDVAEFCNGVSNTCPADGFVPSTVECRAAFDICDVAENCTGTGPSCPPDAFVPATTTCRPAAGVCDLAENCPGDFPSCPPDDKRSDECRPSAGVCDVAESCDGASDDCPADGVQPSTVECRGSAGVCDVAESCTGSSVNCPADALQPSSFTCRGSAGDCDVAENCTGSSASCPADTFQASTVECRASAGDCDVAENCTGSSASCPADGFKASTVECRASAGDCDVAENCTGSSATCPADAFQPSTHECRASVDVCDVAENCTGSDAACPTDAVQPATTACRPSAGDCDVAENCDGTGTACPADAFAPATQVCRAAADQCDVAENCTGSTAACPADGFQPDGTTCNDGVACTISDQCAGGVCTGSSMTCGDGIVQGACGEECDDGNTNRTTAARRPVRTSSAAPATPGPLPDASRPSCPGKAQIQLKNKTPDTGDALVWKWSKGSRTTVLDFGDPTTTTAYELCIYDQGGLKLSASVPADNICAGKPCWAAIGAKGFKYKNKAATPDGLTQILLKEGADGKAKISVKGKGVNLDDPNLATLAEPVRVQLQNTIGKCWEATYSAPPTKQAPDQFKDKAD